MRDAIDPKFCAYVDRIGKGVDDSTIQLQHVESTYNVDAAQQ
jgi:hypothetical protein